MTRTRLLRIGRLLRRRRRETGAASLGLLVLLAGMALSLPRAPAKPWPTTLARTGRFSDTLMETGTISAARLMLYSSAITGGAAKIIRLVREGTSVRAGDVLVQFDASTYEQELAKQTAALQQAQASLRQAREDLRLEQLEAQSARDEAQRRVGYAESGLADQTEGTGKVAMAEAEAAAARTARNVERTQAAYRDLQPLLAQGFITRAELARAKQQWDEAEEQKRLADLKLETLRRYGRPAAVGRARAEVDTAHEELARQKDSSQARVAQRRAAVAAAEGQVREVQAQIALQRQRIERATVRAQGPGLVVYRDIFFGGDRRKPQVGDEVWPNQPILAVPDSSRLIVDTRVREVDLHRIADSQNVHVRVDAYPGLRLRASVELIGALAQDDADRTGTRYFPVTIRLLDTDPRLRTGMTASVEIDVASIAKAVIVPSQAVFEDAGHRECIVLRQGKPVRQLVTVAGDNGIDAAIGRGVAAGDTVLLVDPFRKAGEVDTP